MAYPTAPSYNGGTTARGTSHVISMPSGIVAGNLLLIAFATDGDNTVSNWNGFSELFSTSNGTASSLHIAYKIAVGSDTLTITVTSSEEGSYVIFRIIDHDSVSNLPEVSVGATGDDINPDSDQITMLVSKDYMFLALEGHDHTDITSGYPTTHPDNRRRQTGPGSGSCCVTTATREYTGTVDDPSVFTMQGIEQWVACTCAIYPAAGGIDVPVGQVIETDLAQSIAWAPKNRLVNQVPETDLAQSIAWAPKNRLVNQVAETDLAQAIAWAPKNRLVNQAQETDLSQAIAWAPKNRLVNQAQETDLSQAIAWSPKNRLVNQVIETDLPQSLTSAKLKAIAQVVETDLAQTIGRLKSLLIGQVQETDLAQQITSAGQTVVIVQVTETDLSQALGRIKTREIAQVVQTDLSQAMTSLKTKAVGQIAETDLAQAVAWAPKNRLVNQIVESDLAQAIDRLKTVSIGQVAEIDLSQAIAWAPKNRIVGQVLETDLAQIITVEGAEEEQHMRYILRVLIRDLTRKYIIF